MLGGPHGGHRPCHPTRQTTHLTGAAACPPPAGRALDRDLCCAAVPWLLVGFAALPRDRELYDP
jgi:hypothetical protein